MELKEAKTNSSVVDGSELWQIICLSFCSALSLIIPLPFLFGYLSVAIWPLLTHKKKKWNIYTQSKEQTCLWPWHSHYLRASGTFLVLPFEVSETACEISSQICSACRNKNLEVASLVKPDPGWRFRAESDRTDGKLTPVLLLTFTVSQLKKWMSGFSWSALWQTSKRRDEKCFSVLIASQRKMDLKE